MPTYEYECSKGHTFEAVQRITDEPLKRCKICRSKAQRLISASNFILKGSGWYSDGYSSASGGGGNGADKGSGEASSSTSSSDSKPSSSKGSSAGSSTE